MEIYLISLEQDKQRRSELAQRFPDTYPKMQWVKAVNGKELSAKDYFSYAQQYFTSHQKMITPSEVGCTLSHLQALSFFLKTDKEYCLMLEDDVIGNDNDLNIISELINNGFSNGLILLRDQNKFGFEKYILGKKYKNYYKLSKFSIRFVFGACAYIVDRTSAQNIFEHHQHNFEIADIWSKIINKSSINFYYSPILTHPENLSSSNIENERKLFYEINFWKRIIQQGIFWKIFNRIRNDVSRWMLLLQRYEQIHGDKVK
jgi:glycosyl transferase family 25